MSMIFGGSLGARWSVLVVLLSDRWAETHNRTIQGRPTVAKRASVESEEYGIELDDIGPVLFVAEDRAGARFEMEVGYWGIVVRIPDGQVSKLRDQLDSILKAHGSGAGGV